MSLDAWHKEQSLKYPLKCLARPSNLSKCQVVEIERQMNHFYPLFRLAPEYLMSEGDCDKIRSLRSLEKSNFFTDSIDAALLKGSARVAIHSAKDLPSPLSPGLFIAAITRSIDERDALVISPKIDISKPLPSYLRVATSSKRREEAASLLLDQPQFGDLRGTIEERLALIENGSVDAIIVAEAALIRLNLTHWPRLYLPGTTTEGQGSLAIVVREKDQELIDLFSILDQRQGRPLCCYLGLEPERYKSAFALIHLPLIEPLNYLPLSEELLKQLLEGFTRASHILLTSPRAAQYLWQTLESSTGALNLASEKKWICIGPATANALNSKDLAIEIAAEGSTAEALIRSIQDLQGTNAFVLYPHSKLSRGLLKKSLVDAQVSHLELIIYDTFARTIDDDSTRSLVEVADELIFTSPSSVYAFFQQIIPSSKSKLTCLGPITEKALEKTLSENQPPSTLLHAEDIFKAMLKRAKLSDQYALHPIEQELFFQIEHEIVALESKRIETFQSPLSTSSKLHPDPIYPRLLLQKYQSSDYTSLSDRFIYESKIKNESPSPLLESPLT